MKALLAEILTTGGAGDDYNNITDLKEQRCGIRMFQNDNNKNSVRKH